MKTCSKCKTNKETKYFHKSVSSKDGLKPRCKECVLGHVVHVRELPKGIKCCSKCKEEKSMVCFDKSSSTKDGYAFQCKVCKSSPVKAKRLVARLKRHREAMLAQSLLVEKCCTKCGLVKPISDFILLKTGTRRGDCKKCSYRASHIARRKKHLLDKYGLTPEEYEAKSASQSHLCEICNKVEAHANCSLAVDHDHNTNKVRGLLCSSCNLLLGHAKDSVAILKKSILYLKKYSARG